MFHKEIQIIKGLNSHWLKFAVLKSQMNPMVSVFYVMRFVLYIWSTGEMATQGSLDLQAIIMMMPKCTLQF